MAYQLEGSLLEVCTCNILCPCWVGEDPDGGICEGVLAWHFDAGAINGVDVSGRTDLALVVSTTPDGGAADHADWGGAMLTQLPSRYLSDMAWTSATGGYGPVG